MADPVAIVAGLGGVILGQALGYVTARSRLKGEARFEAYKGLLELTKQLDLRPAVLTKDELATDMLEIERRLTIAYGQGSNITARWRDLAECQDILRNPRYKATGNPTRHGVVKVYNDVLIAVEATSRAGALGRWWQHVIGQTRLGWPAHRALYGSYWARTFQSPGNFKRGRRTRLES